MNVPEVKLENVEQIEGEWFVQIPNVRSRRGPEFRDLYLPPTLLDELRAFAESGGIGRGEPLVDRTKRTVQKRVKQAAEEYAAVTEDSDYGYVSSSDLRRYFAWKLLFEDRVHIRVVMELGGWDHLDSLETYMPFPTRERLFDELGRVSEVAAGD